MTPPGEDAGAAPGRSRRRWLRNRPIRLKLAVILLLPLLAIIGLTGLTVASAAGRAADAGLAREFVLAGGVAARLISSLQVERTAAALVFADGGAGSGPDDYRRAYNATDSLTAEFRTATAPFRAQASMTGLLDRIDASLRLAPLRQQVLSAQNAVLSAAAFRYRAAIADLISYRQALGQAGVSTELSHGLRAAAALSAAIESTGQLGVATVRALASNELTPAGQQEVVTANAGITEAMQTFVGLAPPSWPLLLDRRLAGGEQVLLAERLQSLVTRSEPGAILRLGTDARGWSAAVGARMMLMHSVESDLDAELLTAVTAERDAELRSIYAALGVVAALLAVAIALAWIIASSLSRSLRRLQAGAIEVAANRLPQMVRDLDVDNASPSTVQRLMAAAAQPIPADGTDEVGRVAEAFNHVTSSAVRIAGEQAALRASVGAMLVSLARRLQLRADAMMGSLDALEEREDDPDRLERLFALDHIATLIRRMIFNLQVLAGGRGGRGRTAAVPLADVLRAAGQEIEQFKRVVTTAVDDSVRVRGEAVDELIHLLAELLDNATRFSPPGTQVNVEAMRVGDLLHIQIRDRGTGMADADLELARRRIVNPGRLDHRATQHMGLPVVGAIANQLGIKIEFRSILRTGTWVDLTVPAEIVDRRRKAIQAPTAELPTVSRALPALVWPALAAGSPVSMAQPVIFDEMRRRSSLFAPGPSDQRDPVSASWQKAAQAARAIDRAEIAERTRSGLPVREPGRRVIPTVAPVSTPPTPIRREPEQLRRQMSGYQYGLGLAGRSQFQNS